MNNDNAGCGAHNFKFSLVCIDCAEAIVHGKRWGMMRSAVNVNKKILESVWGISDQQLGEFCHEEFGIVDVN